MHQGQAGGGANGLRAGPARRRLAILLYSIAGAVYVLDRVTKILAERFLQGGPPVEIIPGVFSLRFTTNPGGAFGLFGGLTWLFVGISVVVIAAVVLASRRLPSATTAAGLGLVLGGAVGNLTDRALRGPRFSGQVVDFVDLQVWPVFNLADAAIVIGAAVLLLAAIRRERPPPEQPA